MKNSLVTFTLSTLVITSVASAQPRDGITKGSAESSDSLEISVGGTYTQGGGTMSSPELGNPGGGVELTAGTRFLGKHLTIGGYGTFGALVDSDADDTAIASVGAKADWHFVPSASVDPWVSLGAGARIQWAGDRDQYSGTRLGIEFAKVQAGVDFQVTPSFFLAPTIGATATLFTHESTNMTDGYDVIDDKRVNLLFTAGLQGRFDVFGAAR